MCPITASMAERRRSSRLMTPKTPRFWPEMKTRRGLAVSWPPLDLAAGEPFGGFDDGAERVAIVGVSRQRLGVQHELAARGAGVGGDDRGLDAKLVGGAGLAFADALGLGSVEGIKLPAALALLLRADLLGARERPLEHGLKISLAADLAADVTDDPTKPGAQQTQLPAVTVELLGMGIAPRHHCGALGDAQI